MRFSVAVFDCRRCGHLAEGRGAEERCPDCDRLDYGADQATRLANDVLFKNLQHVTPTTFLQKYLAASARRPAFDG